MSCIFSRRSCHATCEVRASFAGAADALFSLSSARRSKISRLRQVLLNAAPASQPAKLLLAPAAFRAITFLPTHGRVSMLDVTFSLEISTTASPAADAGLFLISAKAALSARRMLQDAEGDAIAGDADDGHSRRRGDAGRSQVIVRRRQRDAEAALTWRQKMPRATYSSSPQGGLRTCCFRGARL